MYSLIASIAIILLAACATPYQPKGYRGGYTDTQLGENIYRVAFSGNAAVSEERPEDMAMLRAAELTLNNGFTHFVIIQDRSGTEYSTYTTPVRSTTTGTVDSFGTINARTTSTGGGTETIARARSKKTIMCYKGKPDSTNAVYDAAFLYKSLRVKYEITD